MAPATPWTRNWVGLLALLCFLCLSVAPVSADPGTPFTLTVKKSETEPLVGVNCYVFSGAGSYLGKVGATNSNGDVTFDLADGAYKFRVDYLGYQFWSDIYSVPTSQSGVLTIPHEEVVITVEGLNQGSPDPMQGLNVYLFTGSGAYMGQSRVTNGDGEAVFNLPDRSYKVRADYLGRQYWSEVFQWQDETVTIPMGNAEITVTGSGIPLAGVNAYVFSAAGAYLGIHGATDSSGKAVFTLPAGSYKYRADYQATQYWSSEEPLVAGQTNAVAISTGGGSFGLTVQRGASDPLAGVNCYLFNEAGIYLGINGTTDSGGLVSFNVSNGAYRFRVDYLGYQFWSEIYSVPTSLSGTLTIPHQDVLIRAEGLNQGSPHPMEGISVCLFTASGSYLGQSRVTNSSGEVTFHLPESAYKVRADYLGQQFWSEPFIWQDKTVTVPTGEAEITVTGSGLPLAGVNVYVFSGTGAYLEITGSTNSSGKVFFTLPAGSYRYRADYQANQYWSGGEPLVPGQINLVTLSTGGGTFALTVQRGPADPLAEVNCYVFSGAGSYLGMSGASNTVGAVSFNLPDGAYKFRADYFGYQFWSDVYSVPTSLSGILTVPHQNVAISVVGVNQAPIPMAGVPVYLFTASGAYMSQSLVTDGNGQVTFSLPEQGYKVRADYLGQEFWSEAFTWQNATVSIPMGEAELTVTSGGNPLGGVPVYVFSATGSYLIVSGTTDGNGKTLFTLPAGSYKYRADYQGNQYWSGEEPLIAGQINAVALSTGGGSFILKVMKNETEPLSGVNCYVFDEAGGYLGLTGITDGSGEVPFDLSDGIFKFRADYLGYPFWSEIYLVPTSFSAILTIPHQDTVIGVEALNQGAPVPMEGVNVYLFTPSDSYLGQSLVTKSNGEVIFSLPDQPYKVRADYLGQQFWAEIFQWQNITLTIPMGDSEVTITDSGTPLAGVNVYVFSADGAYLGLSGVTDGNGKVFFTLAAGLYKFRADYQENQYWSDESSIIAGQVNPVNISDTVQVPDVAGLSQSVAEAAITGAGLSVGTISGEHSATVPEGHVISQSPAAGSSIQEGSPVDLVISLGSEALPVDEFKLWASDGAEYDEFGRSVSISGEYALVGASSANDSVGAAYVFKWDGTTWIQVAKLTATDGAQYDYFGGSVSLNGDYAFVGASGANEYTGAAYVFKREGETWTQAAKLTASDGAQYDGFGGSVSLNGDYALVGASCANGYAGAAYIFKWDGTSWIQAAKLIAADGAQYDDFGDSVSLDGDYALVGAPYANEYMGAAYVFKRDGTSWTDVAKLTASDASEDSSFGMSVSISGDYAIVGAPDVNEYTGAAYVFNRDGATWTQVAKLTADAALSDDEFGISVSIDGDYAVVGAYENDDGGSAYIFKRLGGTWTQAAKLKASDRTSHSGFGISISLKGDYAIVGAPYADAEPSSGSGAAYIYPVQSYVGRPYVTLTEPNGFGDTADLVYTIRWIDMDLDDNATISLYYDTDDHGADGTLIVSGLREDPDGEGNDKDIWDTSQIPEGTYYIYVVAEDGKNNPMVYYSGGMVTIDHPPLSVDEVKITATDARDHDFFGNSVAISGEYAIVGAFADDNYTGAAYIFKREGDEWFQEAKLTGSITYDHCYFGRAVAINGDCAVVADYHDSTLLSYVYVFKRESSGWVEKAILSASDATNNDYFGWSLSVDGDYVVVGADFANAMAGAAYVFKREGETWIEQAKLTASDAAEGDSFGESVGISGDYVIVGANGDDEYAGAAYIFKRQGSTWIEQAKLAASDAAGGSSFGGSVSLSAGYAVVGASRADNYVGSAYVFGLEGENWIQRAKLIPWGEPYYSEFGRSVSISGDFAIVGSGSTDRGPRGQGSGVAYTFRREGSTWTPYVKLTASDAEAGDSFGISVAADGMHAIVGASKDNDYAGSAYIYSYEVGETPATFAATDINVVPGEWTALFWDCPGATSVTIDNGIGSVPSRGSLVLSPTETTTYTITATGPWGTFTDSVTITVIFSPTVSLSAAPLTLFAGESSTLIWSSSHAESCVIEPGVGSVDLSGTLQVTPFTTTTYIITATGPGGTASDSVVMQVIAPHEDAGYGLEADEQEGGGGLIGETVRISDGNVVEVRSDLELSSPDRRGFILGAAYNSRSQRIGSMGYGWTHTYEASLAPVVQIDGFSFLRIIDGTGSAAYFREETSGVYSGFFGEYSRVRAQEGGYVWYRLDGTKYVFSSSGRLTRMEDALGNSLELSYGANNEPQTVIDTASGRILTFHYNAEGLLDRITGPVTASVPDGVWVTYGYDANQNLTIVTYADGSGYSYVYSDANDIHNLTQKKDLLNHVLREWSYNSNDQATAALTPDGEGVTLITYGGTQVQVRDVYNINRTYTLAMMGGRKKVIALTGITNASYTESNAIRWVYDDRSRLMEVEYGGGTINRYQNYDERGNPGTVILAYGSGDQRTIQYTYHPEMNVPLRRTEPSVLGSGNKVTIWDYDNDYNATANEAPTRLLSRLIEQGYTVDMNGTVVSYEYITTFTYNAKGQVLSVDGPRSGTGDTTTFAYNATTGNLESVTQPLVGTTTFTEYDAAGRPGRVTDVNGQAKGFTYDGRGRVTAVINYADSPASSTQFAYVGGLLDSVTDPDGISQFFGYDGLGRLSTITDEDGNYISHTYETYPRGNLTETSKYTSSQTRTSRKRWSYEQPTYPGKLYREIQADDTFREYDYDSAGNVIWAKDPKGYTTTFGNDFMNRIESVAQRVNDPDPRDLVTSYAYDTHGNLISVTDAKSNETIYDYDDMGSVVSTDSPDTGIQTTAYDQAGNLRYKTDAKSVRVEYTYDNLNRITAAIYPDSVDDIAYTYDQGTNGKGHLTTMDDPAGLIAFGYDPRGRLTQKTSTISGVNYPVTYAYTPGGKVGSVTYPSGRVMTYDRNALGKISEVTASGLATPLASGLTYKPFGGPLGLTNGFGGTVNNQAGECDCLTISNPGQPRERTYGYDPNRNLTSITGTTTPWYSQTFGYDQLNRLTSAAGRYGSIAYTYDEAGNRLTRNTNGVNETFSYYTGTNRLQTITGGSNPRTFAYDANGNITGDGTLTFLYDQPNEMKEVKQGQTSKATYSYNGLGQRVKKVAGGVTTIYHYDLDGKLIAEGLPNGTMTREYLYMGKVRVAMVDVAGGNALYHYLNDRLGTPEILTNATGTVAWEAWYEPFGEAHIHPNSSVENNIRFPGQYFDQETGLHYNYHRYYDPRTGRYITGDPIGLKGGINLFSYAFNDPMNVIDSTGLGGFPGVIIGATSGALAGYVSGKQSGNVWAGIAGGAAGGLAGGFVGFAYAPGGGVVGGIIGGAISGAVGGATGGFVGATLKNPNASLSEVILATLKGVVIGEFTGAAAGGLAAAGAGLGAAEVVAEVAGEMVVLPIGLTLDVLETETSKTFAIGPTPTLNVIADEYDFATDPGQALNDLGSVLKAYASDDTISPAAPVNVWVDSSGLGKPPYQWQVSGKGYSLSLTTTTGDFIPTTVSVVSGTCGANYAPYVTVTVTDALGAHDSIVIKNSAGSWVELTTLDRTFCSLPDPWYNGGSSTPYDLIVGSQRWYMHQVTGGTPACGNIVTSGWSSYGYGAACDSFDIWPPCGTPTQCAIMYGNVTCTDPSYQVPAYQQVQYYEWECR